MTDLEVILNRIEKKKTEITHWAFFEGLDWAARQIRELIADNNTKAKPTTLTQYRISRIDKNGPEYVFPGLKGGYVVWTRDSELAKMFFSMTEAELFAVSYHLKDYKVEPYRNSTPEYIHTHDIGGEG